MWVFTVRGFYSVVASEDPEVFVVRARAKVDLANLREFIPGLKIVKLPNRDYEFRAFVPRPQWEHAILEMTRQIDYGNFKDEVKHVQGPKRASIYSRIWAAALDIAPANRPKWERRRWSRSHDDDVMFGG